MNSKAAKIANNAIKQQFFNSIKLDTFKLSEVEHFQIVKKNAKSILS